MKNKTNILLMLIIIGCFLYLFADTKPIISINTGMRANLWIDSTNSTPSKVLTFNVVLSDQTIIPSNIRVNVKNFDGLDVPVTNESGFVYSIKPGAVGPYYVITTIFDPDTSDTTTIGIIPKGIFSKSYRFGIAGVVKPPFLDFNNSQIENLLKLIGAKCLRDNDDLLDTSFFNYRNIPTPYVNCSPYRLADWLPNWDVLKKNPKINSLVACNEVNDIPCSLNLTNNVEWLKDLADFRDLNPNYKNSSLAMSSITCTGVDYLESLINASSNSTLANYSIIDYHAPNNSITPDVVYTGDPNHYFLSSLQKLRNLNKRFTPQKKIWIGEFYACTYPYNNGIQALSCNENTAAANLTLQTALAIAMGVDKLFFWCLFDYNKYKSDKSELENAQNSENHYGLFKKNGTAKATVWAYQTAAYYLDSASFIGEINLPNPNHRGLLFSTKIGEVAVVWNRVNFSLTPCGDNVCFTACDYPGSNGICKNDADQFFVTFNEQLYNQPPWYSFYGNDPIRNSELTVTLNPLNYKVVDCIGKTIPTTLDKWHMGKIKLTGAPIYIIGGNFNVYNKDPSKLFSHVVSRRKASVFDYLKDLGMTQDSNCE